MDTNVDTRDEQHPDTAGTRARPAQEPGDEAGAILGMPADPTYRIDTHHRWESDAWSWLEPLSALLELLAQFGR